LDYSLIKFKLKKKIKKGVSFMKKILLTLLFVFSGLQGQENENLGFQKLQFDIGINLVCQDQIVDWKTAEKSVLSAYQEVDNFAQFINIYLMIDEVMVVENITSLEGMINYHTQENDKIKQLLTNWLFSYQNIYSIFISIHDIDDISFQTWLDDLKMIQETEMFDNPLYGYFITALIMEEEAFQSLQDALQVEM